RHRRREIHPRFHPVAAEPDRGGLRAPHALLRRQGNRRSIAAAFGLHQIDREPAMNEDNYLNAGYSLRSWFFTTDHKRIAILYFASLIFFFFVGGTAATAIRIELATPEADLVSADMYNRLFTMHGIIMVWF